MVTPYVKACAIAISLTAIYTGIERGKSMTAEIHTVKFFTPRVPKDADTERTISGDLQLIEQAAAALITMRTQIVRSARPLTPARRADVIAAHDALTME